MKRLGYALYNYTRNGGKTSLCLINLGEQLSPEPKIVSYKGKHRMSTHLGEDLISSDALRGYETMAGARSIAERLTSVSINPADFVGYNPNTDRYEIRIAEVRESSEGVTIGGPILGVSHALGTFGFRRDGKRVMTKSVSARKERHKADRRISAKLRTIPAI